VNIVYFQQDISILKNVDNPIIIESLMLDQNIVKRRKHIFVGVLFILVVVG